MKKSVLFGISGGNSFRDHTQLYEHYKNYDIDYIHTEKYWMDWLMWSLENECACIKLKMPGSDNADYGVWKIMFEKYLHKYGSEDLNIVSHSLGTTFILKYLVECDLKINHLHLVAPFVSDDFQPSDFNESTGSFTFDHSVVNTVAERSRTVNIWYSEDDDVCTPKHAEYLHKQIKGSQLFCLEDRGHFNQSTFWELFEELKSGICE
ncbi:alpha/beta hydrolase [bacterium]|nr:alpha/beta hydrolase [bacterium]